MYIRIINKGRGFFMNTVLAHDEVFKLKCTKCGEQMLFEDSYPLVQCQTINGQARIYIQETGIYLCSNSDCNNSYYLPYPQEPAVEWRY